ncbi:hypothetical protein CHS0354_027929 [Potamilus streckersoni]|uniref:Tox-ART-HYD1 domain-containing protein n=1 Tax=Potamilus streckersoni TaxID=2493646 RepID=A0AAE0WB43_9BIVA|nr:hypothetical protein CHS0354_027929 [Potamilus streckersoni]
MATYFRRTCCGYFFTSINCTGRGRYSTDKYSPTVIERCSSILYLAKSSDGVWISGNRKQITNSLSISLPRHISEMSVTLYHHTSWQGFKGIWKEGRIKESTVESRDARFGRGVYLTSLGPETSEEDVLHNNYDDAEMAIRDRMDRVEVIIEVRVSKQNVEEAPSKRDIYIHKGEIANSAITGMYKRDGKGKARRFRIKN